MMRLRILPAQIITACGFHSKTYSISCTLENKKTLFIRGSMLTSLCRNPNYFSNSTPVSTTSISSNNSSWHRARLRISSWGQTSTPDFSTNTAPRKTTAAASSGRPTRSTHHLKSRLQPQSQRFVILKILEHRYSTPLDPNINHHMTCEIFSSRRSS